MKIKDLSWDSDYFGLHVAEISDLEEIKYYPSEIVSGLTAKKIDLAYCRSEKLLEDFENEDYHFQYVLKRLPLIKEMKEDVPYHSNISIYKEKEPDANLVKIAQLTGRMGRFGKDPNVTFEQCDEIFKSLITNSVNGTLASDVLVYKENNEIIGFCTIRLMENEAYIPIIGVFPEYAGTGVGFSLMKAVETYLFHKNRKFAIGGTQDFNEQAKKAFVRFGMTLGEPEYFYHIWNKNKIIHGE